MCAAFDLELHLIEPLGFKIDDRHLKRAGLDYWPHVKLSIWSCWQAFLAALPLGARLIMATTKGHISLPKFHFECGDALIFGPETRGLPMDILAQSPYKVRIPIASMQNGGVRSLNLSTAAGIMAYAALASCSMLEKW